MVKHSNTSYENEIHRIDSRSNEDFKNNFFQGGPNFGGGMVGIFWENGRKREIYCYAN